MNGILNVCKPPGLTSRDAVNRVQRMVRPAKVGHAGTLDPLAEGVLVVAIGSATRLIEYIQRMPKSYRAEFLFGFSSDTEDSEGNVVRVQSPVKPSRQQLESVFPQFIGTIDQIPPAYSALKLQGRRAYQMARSGVIPKLAARPVNVYHLSVVEYDYPRLTIDIVCGQGTYVRSLGRDLAHAVKASAIMAHLTRAAVGCFRLSDALPLQKLETDEWISCLQPLETAVSDLPAIQLSEQELLRLSTGRSIERENMQAEEYAAFAPTGELASIVTRRGSRLMPARNFMTHQGQRA
jgi:tRNA pseudouridine55 synthase